MYNNIKKNMPTGIMAVGFIIFFFLTVFSKLAVSGEFSYNSFVMAEYLNEAALLVLFECIAGAIAFKICLKKEKSLDRDS